MVKLVWCALLFVRALGVCCWCDPSSPNLNVSVQGTSFELVFSDEFDSSSLSAARWAPKPSVDASVAYFSKLQGLWSTCLFGEGVVNLGALRTPRGGQIVLLGREGLQPPNPVWTWDVFDDEPHDYRISWTLNASTLEIDGAFKDARDLKLEESTQLNVLVVSLDGDGSLDYVQVYQRLSGVRTNCLKASPCPFRASALPTREPTTQAPGAIPTTRAPGKFPTKEPTTDSPTTPGTPTKAPGKFPTREPTTSSPTTPGTPTKAPGKFPTKEPTTSSPTTPGTPTSVPTTKAPGKFPTKEPTTLSPTPAETPTAAPTTKAPGKVPTTKAPTTASPTPGVPTPKPTEPTPKPTEPPTTRAPNKPAPTTAVPTTASPTTPKAPTTAAPTTAAPTTAAPTTSAPTTLSPTTIPPSPLPTTERPTTLAPSPTPEPTKAPSTKSPTPEPTTAQPTHSPTPPTTATPTHSPTTGSPTTPSTAAPTRPPTLKPSTPIPTIRPTTGVPTQKVCDYAYCHGHGHCGVLPSFPTKSPTPHHLLSSSDPTTAVPTTHTPTQKPHTASPTVNPYPFSCICDDGFSGRACEDEESWGYRHGFSLAIWLLVLGGLGGCLIWKKKQSIKAICCPCLMPAVRPRGMGHVSAEEEDSKHDDGEDEETAPVPPRKPVPTEKSPAKPKPKGKTGRLLGD